ncbi:acyl carrier protein [Actinomadura harenae]|uniref:Acyl carrier protein n=1 Tax=Actinomadura harenae TaxID=2483351 RepID=A0A3M2M417_9ACTN|nr:acyl carrier protein [Actinomadura harenae]
MLAQLTGFLKTMLKPDQFSRLGPETPLREFGVLDSLGMARLVTFIRDDMGVAVPMRHLTGARFRSLDDITDLVLTLRA